LDTVLAIEPANKSGRGEARRIDRKFRLDSAEWQCAPNDQRPEVRGQFFLFHVAVDLVWVQRAGQMPAPVRFLQVAIESPARQGRPDFQAHGKQPVSKWDTQRSGALVVWWINYAAAQICQQDLHAILFLLLRLIISDPILLVRRPLGNRVRVQRKCLFSAVAFPDKPRSNDMFAVLLPELVVVACTSKAVKRALDFVFHSVAGLRRHETHPPLPNERYTGRDFQSLQFSNVHVTTPRLIYT